MEEFQICGHPKLYGQDSRILWILQAGQKGEEQAIGYLRGIGYRILHVNWRYKKLEIDIIAQNDEFLVIVEVKTRKNAVFGEPETFVTKLKQQKIIRATHHYILEFGI